MERPARPISVLDRARACVLMAAAGRAGIRFAGLAALLAVPSLSPLQSQTLSTMVILVLTWNYPPRRVGIEYLIGQLAAGLRKRHAVHVITAYNSRSECTEKNQLPVRFFCSRSP